MNLANESDRTWSIILAGGEGERMRPFLQRWLGRHIPKQYCTFVGSRSMLEHTLDRAFLVGSPERCAIVIAAGHEQWLRLSDQFPGRVIRQPANRGTAAGIFLPLTHVRALDPEATVVIYPSDHFVHPGEQFAHAVRRVVHAAGQIRDRVVLLGAQPDKLELEYGWIHPGVALEATDNHELRAVERFEEKPSLTSARAALEAGGLWNTLVFAVKVGTLWTLGWRYLPDLMPLFEEIGDAIGTSRERAVIELAYGQMPVRNFSVDFLERATQETALVEMTDVVWSDWGRPERIIETLRRCGIQPALSARAFFAGRTKTSRPMKAARSNTRKFATDGFNYGKVASSM